MTRKAKPSRRKDSANSDRVKDGSDPDKQVLTGNYELIGSTKAVKKEKKYSKIGMNFTWSPNFYIGEI